VQNIPVIPNTSKTFAELIEIRGALGLTTPFVVENGAAVYIPQSFFKHQPAGTFEKSGFWVKELSQPVEHWLSVIQNLKSSFSNEFQHFSTMSVAQICDATGLSEHDASLAAQREYCEPVLWLGSEQAKQQFIQAVEEMGASPLQGGRFLHVTGKCNKAHALSWLMAEYKKQNPNKKCMSIALGDGHNDIAMLEEADYAVRILSPTSEPPKLNRTTNLITSKSYGPQGWAESINTLIFN
jgi:mannosyl-3-phosphoglycerate phosphatase